MLRDIVTFPFDLETCHVMPLGWSIPVPSFNWIQLTVSELGRLQFSLSISLKSKFLHVWDFGGSVGEISNVIFLTPKRHFLGGMMYSDVLCVVMCL